MEALIGEADSGKLAYHFRPGVAEGSAAYSPILGEKGAYLAEMATLGVNVPPGFTLTSKVCNTFFSDGRVLCDNTRELLLGCVEELEDVTGRLLGSPDRPLLLAVRSGSCVSMPGMMDTILNIGFNREVAEALAPLTGNPLFAYECYYRLILKYATSVLGFTATEGPAQDKGEPFCRSVEELRRKIEDLLMEVAAATGKPFPQDPREQLVGAVGAIFSSWESESAVAYRQIFNIPRQFGTAATIQQMVFGNFDEQSCSGVAFSRNPLTGERRLFGEYLPRSQGEVLVCGAGKPLPLSADERDRFSRLSFEIRFPELYWELDVLARKIERHLRDMQDIEFTVENNSLYLLQARPAKRTDHAALRVAIDLAAEGIIAREEAVARFDQTELKQLFVPVFNPNVEKRLILRGNPASPGVVCGRIAFRRSEAIESARARNDTILVAERTTPNDIGAIAVSRGVLTREGGMTSHAAINSRRMAKPCVTGCEALDIDREREIVRIGPLQLGTDDVISIDGHTGEVFLGAVEIVSGRDSPDFEQYMNTYLKWKKEVKGQG